MYIDPNTGGMLFQVLAAVFAALSGIVLIFSGRIRAFFAKMRRHAREVTGEEKERIEDPETDQTTDS